MESTDQLSVGSDCQVLFDGKWWNCCILSIQDQKFKVKFEGWSSKHNAEVNSSHIRVALPTTNTKLPRNPRRHPNPERFVSGDRCYCTLGDPACVCEAIVRYNDPFLKKITLTSDEVVTYGDVLKCPKSSLRKPSHDPRARKTVRKRPDQIRLSTKRQLRSRGMERSAPSESPACYTTSTCLTYIYGGSLIKVGQSYQMNGQTIIIKSISVTNEEILVEYIKCMNTPKGPVFVDIHTINLNNVREDFVLSQSESTDAKLDPKKKMIVFDCIHTIGMATTAEQIQTVRGSLVQCIYPKICVALSKRKPGKVKFSVQFQIGPVCKLLGLELYNGFSVYFLPATFYVHLDKLFGNTNWDYKESRHESHFVTSFEALLNWKTLEIDISFQFSFHPHILDNTNANRRDTVTAMMANAHV